MTSLKQLVERVGPLNYRRAARYVADVALQLSELHARGDLHRDIRPAVLALDEKDRVKLQPSNLWQNGNGIELDSMADEESILEIAGYLAPELALNSGAADARADIYSLGCTFYFLLSGHPPFCEGSVSERLLKHQVATAPAVSKDRPNAPHTLEDLCEQMMSKKREDRPQTSLEVSIALNAWLTGDEAV